MTTVDYVLRLGDDALVTAQRLGAWYAAGPEMEEDVALANIALDQLGAARLLLTYAGELEGAGRDEDALAYQRGPADFRNCRLVEQPEPDFGVVIAKLLLLSAFQLPCYEALAGAGDERLSAIAGKARKESAYHLDHATLWTLRLGDGTDESHQRMQASFDTLWPFVDGLFAGDDGGPVDPAELRKAWTSTVEDVLGRATLTVPAPVAEPTGERTHLVELLAEMQQLHRAHPGARW
ncbi:ring-1,2-phenylacetyl-CoA epoxidase subunit PaaC [Asanoa hainanensis]|uniref:Ring-1,2-phenylacetyl-CoA epoxidase subunit PaaC n=1 Tax=Asanoa hainanensis TaxID=560556 RepID=A0A239NQA8_9ACTN|nr:1,2-phenylacetyl-CoA epoxidase subunit PaaC [Asanoa hainanensis]SNT57067.1 ring-1,2-phenylacetyl-CoA epoxidase subunit PaaC [Asanoa hainanensis]